MKRIPRERALVYALDATLDPVLTVESGEPFAIETEDASSGLLTRGDVLPTAENLPYVRHSPAKANPVGGPVFVNGVRPRGRVRIDIVEVALAPSGVAYNRPALSPLEDSRQWPEGGEPFAVRVEHRDGEAVVSPRLRWRLSPMIGTLACVPEWEVHSSSTGQGPWGGNLDVVDFAAGATVYLNAYHEGGLVFAGDVHGCQGDGEYLGVADESRAELVLRVSPEGGSPLPAPRVRTKERVIALGIDKPLEAAAHAAVKHRQPLDPEVPLRYHTAIGDAAGLPLVLFNLQPALGGVLYSPETLHRLCQVTQVAAIKEASFDAKLFVDIREAVKSARPDCVFLTGNDNFIYESFVLGAEGALIGFGAVATRQQVELIELALDGRLDEARAIMHRLTPLANAIFAAPVRDYRARAKEALVMQGILERATVREPLLPISSEDRLRVREAMVLAGELEPAIAG